MIATCDDLIDYYNSLSLGYLTDKPSLLAKCSLLPSNQKTSILVTFLQLATDETFISFIGSAYDKRFGRIEQAFINQSQYGLLPLQSYDVEKINKGILSEKALQTLLSRLKIAVERPKSKQDVEREKEEASKGQIC